VIIVRIHTTALHTKLTHSVLAHKSKNRTKAEACGERRYTSYSFTISDLVADEWSASRPGRALTPGERTPGTHCTRGWVGPRAGLDTEDRGKILCPCRGSNPDSKVVQPVVRHYTAWANPAPSMCSTFVYYHIRLVIAFKDKTAINKEVVERNAIT
jgi:hypothetical protein